MRGLSTSVQLALGLVVSQALTAVTYLLAARSATPAQFGGVAALTALATTVSAILDWGGTSQALRSCASGQMSDREFGAWMKGRTALYVGVAVLFGAWIVSAHRPPAVVVAGTCGLIVSIGFSTPASVPWRSKELFGRVALNSVCARVPGTLAMVACVRWGNSAYLLLPAILAASAALEGIGARRGWGKKSRRPSRTNWQPWRGTLHLGASSALLGLQGLDVPIVESMGGPAAAGQYGAVNRWTAPMGLLSTAFTQATFPSMAAAADMRSAAAHLRRGVPILAGAALLTLAIWGLAEHLTQLLLGPAYTDSALVLRVLALGVLVAMLNQPLYGLLIAQRLDRRALGCTSSGMFVQLAAIGFLSARFGAVGGAAGLLVGQSWLLLLLVIAGGLPVRGSHRTRSTASSGVNDSPRERGGR